MIQRKLWLPEYELESGEVHVMNTLNCQCEWRGQWIVQGSYPRHDRRALTVTRQ